MNFPAYTYDNMARAKREAKYLSYLTKNFHRAVESSFFDVTTWKDIKCFTIVMG